MAPKIYTVDFGAEAEASVEPRPHSSCSREGYYYIEKKRPGLCDGQQRLLTAY